KEHDMTSTTGTTTTTSTRRASKRGTSHITSLEAVRATAGEPTTDCGVEYLDPAGWLVDVNVRQNPRVDKDLIASIRDHGVLVPVIAVRTGLVGDLRQRRVQHADVVGGVRRARVAR